MLNLSNYPQYCTPEEAEFWGQIELDEVDPPMSQDEAFDYIHGRVFTATWPEDEIPW